MNWLKLFFGALLIILAVFLGFAIIGLVYSAVWYLFWIGVVVLGGYLGYKIWGKDENPEIKGIDAVSQIELDNAKVVRELEEYRQKVNR